MEIDFAFYGFRFAQEFSAHQIGEAEFPLARDKFRGYVQTKAGIGRLWLRWSTQVRPTKAWRFKFWTIVVMTNQANRPSTTALYDVAAARPGALKPAGQWNVQEIRCRGRRVTVTVNDIPILDTNLDDIQDQAVLKKHPGLLRTSGHIGLLGHGSRVEFRNLRVKELSETPQD